MLILVLVMLPFLLAPLAGWLGARSLRWIALIPAGLFAAYASLLPDVVADGALTEWHRWIPSLGVDAAFRLDGLSMLFALMISGVGALVFLYAASYLQGQERLARFYVVLTLFMASMLGAVLADNLLLLVVFWELTSLTSFLLIGTSPEQAASRRSAQQGLLITVGGGLALLTGVILLGTAAGTYSISGILAQGGALAAHPRAGLIVLLLAAGAFAKSAQAPLHCWLPNAMVAPTPVSAFLHSATMVKLGVYLLARLNPVFEAMPLWTGLLMAAGGVTMLLGVVLALRESDLKRVLAYSTIVSLGTLVLLLGMPGPLATLAAVTFLVIHALYKACLFMVAGIIDHETGTRDSTRLGGLGRAMPLTAAAAMLGGLSMAGLPPFVGFMGKELIYEAGLGASGFPGAVGWIVGIALLANAGMVVVAAIIALRCFLGRPVATPIKPHDPDLAMLAGPLLLGAAGLACGLLPGLLAQWLVQPAAAAILGAPIEYELALWHGLTPMLALSGATLALGAVAFWRWNGLRTRLAGLEVIDTYGSDRAYDRLMDGLQRLARWQTDRIQTGSLRNYLGRTFLAIALAGGATLVALGGLDAPAFAPSLTHPESGIALLLVLATLATLGARSFVSGIVAVGMVGFGVALLFLFQGAPDLAFTQFSVEALAIVILLAIVRRLPFTDRDYRSRGERLRDGGVAVAFGVMITLVLLSVLAVPFDARLSDFYRAASVPLAHGRNLVNVIIVDFRALDTLGEITVLGLAALAAAAVLAGLRQRSERR